jgi:hypothetical protein
MSMEIRIYNFSDDYIYLYDYGPGNGMRWMFGPYLGAENGQIRSVIIQEGPFLNSLYLSNKM